jgi:hypothetical protein
MSFEAKVYGRTDDGRTDAGRKAITKAHPVTLLKRKKKCKLSFNKYDAHMSMNKGCMGKRVKKHFVGTSDLDLGL